MPTPPYPTPVTAEPTTMSDPNLRGLQTALTGSPLGTVNPNSACLVKIAGTDQVQRFALDSGKGYTELTNEPKVALPEGLVDAAFDKLCVAYEDCVTGEVAWFHLNATNQLLESTYPRVLTLEGSEFKFKEFRYGRFLSEVAPETNTTGRILIIDEEIVPDDDCPDICSRTNWEIKEWQPGKAGYVEIDTDGNVTTGDYEVSFLELFCPDDVADDPVTLEDSVYDYLTSCTDEGVKQILPPKDGASNINGVAMVSCDGKWKGVQLKESLGGWYYSHPKTFADSSAGAFGVNVTVANNAEPMPDWTEGSDEGDIFTPVAGQGLRVGSKGFLSVSWSVDARSSSPKGVRAMLTINGTPVPGTMAEGYTATGESEADLTGEWSGDVMEGAVMGIDIWQSGSGAYFFNGSMNLSLTRNIECG